MGRVSLPLVLGSAYCSGFVILTVFLQQAETLNVLRGNFPALCLLILLATVFGLSSLARYKISWHISPAALLISFSIALIVYFYTYFILSHYPTGDLFQDVHSMKGAEELGRFGILSPYVTDSYIPIKQALAGILVRTFGFDQLVGYWALGPWTILFKLLVVFAASSIVPDSQQRNVVFVIVSAVVANGDFGNGVLCFFASLLLMTATNKWMRDAVETTRIRNSSLLLLVLVGTQLFLALRWPQLAQAFLLAIAGASLLHFLHVSFEMSPSGRIVTIRKRIDPVLLLIWLIVGSMFLMHRSSIILVPIAMGVAWALAVPMPVSLRRYLIVPGIVLPLCCLAPAGVVVAELLGILNFSDQSERILSWAALVVGSNPGDDFALGTGLRNALVEWARTIGLNFSLVIAATFLHTTISRSGRTLWQDQRFSVPWIIGWSLTLLILIGTPFAYRSSFYVILLFSLSGSVALLQLWKSAHSLLRLSAIAVLVTSGSYLLAAYTLAVYRPYLEFVWPTTIMFAVVAMILVGTFSRDRRMDSMLLVALVTVALSLDRVGARFISLPHSYGRPISPIQAVAHYTEDDLAVAQALRSFEPDTVVLSDPYTMAIIRARTGLGGIVAFSNLDTVVSNKRESLQEAINAARTANKRSYCKVVSQLIGDGAAEYRYAMHRIGKYDRADEVRTLFAFSSRTADWATTTGAERTSYFPNPLPVRGEEIDSIGELGPIVANSHGRTIASLITCPGTAVEELPHDPLFTPY